MLEIGPNLMEVIKTVAIVGGAALFFFFVLSSL